MEDFTGTGMLMPRPSGKEFPVGFRMTVVFADCAELSCSADVSCKVSRGVKVGVAWTGFSEHKLAGVTRPDRGTMERSGSSTFRERLRIIGTAF